MGYCPGKTTYEGLRIDGTTSHICQEQLMNQLTHLMIPFLLSIQFLHLNQIWQRNQVYTLLYMKIVIGKKFFPNSI